MLIVSSESRQETWCQIANVAHSSSAKGEKEAMSRDQHEVPAGPDGVDASMEETALSDGASQRIPEKGADPAEAIDPEWRAYVARVAGRLSDTKAEPAAGLQNRQRAARILIVDDDTAICEMLATALHEAGFACDVAVTGAQALARAERQVYDVLVVDLMIPDVSGLEVVREIRKRNDATRVIIITGFGDVTTAVEALHTRADDYILKPIRIEEFVRSVELSLSRQETLRDIRLSHQRLSRELADLNLRFQRRLSGGVVALATALEARDRYTKGHSARVANMCVELGRALNFHGEELDDLVVGALLHDVGKIAVPDGVLLKDGPLSAADFEKIQCHPRVGYDILFPFFGRGVITECALYHHEHCDGTGYPGHLTQENIPLVGRIISLCDAYDAMTSERPYRAAFPESKALQEVEKHSGTQFDPQVAQLFCKIHPYQIPKSESQS
jgi:putative two-component system response regulator